jgi:predicted TIM-barrel fold metal-dependent hydrolase
LSVDLDKKPAFKAPQLACDSHFHVFGPAGQYPYGSDLRYKPPHAPLEDYQVLARHLGIERMVFVQPSAYGRDNTCMLDAMQSLPFELRRGVVDIDEDAPDSEFARLDALGVRAVRINTSPVKPPEAGYADKLLPRIRKLEGRCAELGWHLDFLCPGWLTTELLGVYRNLTVDFSVAHLGMYLARDGVAQPGFQALLDLLRHGSGHCYVKFTGIYRMSKQPGHADAAPMARAVIEAAADRILWGSDYPHLSFAEESSVALFNLLADWAPDEKTRYAILVDNPQRLFGFKAAALSAGAAISA